MLQSPGCQVQSCDSQSFQCFVYSVITPGLHAAPLNIKANDAEGLIDDKYCCIVTSPRLIQENSLLCFRPLSATVLPFNLRYRSAVNPAAHCGW